MPAEDAPARSLRRRIRSLQALRFFAAALVVVGHAQHEIAERLPVSAGRWYARVPFDWGLGVDIFFAISGFIMMHLMRDRFGAPGAARHFLMRRLIRIVPLYWLCTTLLLATVPALLRRPGGVTHAGASYLFVPWPHPDGRGVFPTFTLGWTLNYEILFYLIFTVALTLRRRAGLALILVAFATLATCGQIAPENMVALRFWGAPIIGEFLFGMAISSLHAHGARLPRTAAAAGVVIGVALAVLAYQTESYQTLTRLLTGGVPGAIILASVVLGLEPKRDGPAVAALALAGDASYALYLTHPFVLKGSFAVASRLGFVAVAEPWVAVAAWAAAVAVSLGVFQYVEKPLIARLLVLAGLERRPPPISVGAPPTVCSQR